MPAVRAGLWTKITGAASAWPEGAYALRLVAAALLALLATHYIPGTHGFSAVLSALIVVRPYQQGAIRAGLMRLMATFIGMMLAFAAVWLKRLGLNDYARLLIGLAPLSLLAAYNSDYRSALIAAVLVIGAPVDADAAIKVGIARAIVVGLGAVIGVAVSVLVLPRPHHDAVRGKSLEILHDMIELMRGMAAGTLTARDGEKADRRLRKGLLELGQMHRDNRKGHEDKDPSAIAVRRLRHAQAVSLLLRGQWRTRTEGEGPSPWEARKVWCAAMLALIAAARKGGADEEAVKAVWKTLPPAEGVEAWMQKGLGADAIAIAIASSAST